MRGSGCESRRADWIGWVGWWVCCAVLVRTDCQLAGDVRHTPCVTERSAAVSLSARRHSIACCCVVFVCVDHPALFSSFDRLAGKCVCGSSIGLLPPTAIHPLPLSPSPLLVRKQLTRSVGTLRSPKCTRDSLDPRTSSRC